MTIKTDVLVINGAPFEGLNPLPAFSRREKIEIATTERFPDHLKETLGNRTKILPHLVQDRYSRKRVSLNLKCIVLENDYLKARFLPEYGGRLHSLYDKVCRRELLFTNPVIQPGNLAIRNAWLSGGIEWNIGSLGHSCTTCDNVFAAVLQDDDGNDFLRIYEFERFKGIFWQIDFHLPDNSPVLISHVKMINPFDKATTTYWWSNIAVPEERETRVLASGKHVISFVGGKCDFETLPQIDQMPGIDVSYPSRAPKAFDYFIQENRENESTWEAAAYPDGVVFFERSTAPLVYKKLFAWGNHRAGKHWQEFLSDGKGTGYYAEIQAGIAPSQLHDKVLPANGVYEWTQCFGGIQLDRDMLFGEYDQAVGYFDNALMSKGFSKEYMIALDESLKQSAQKCVCADNIVHAGSGFGALEIRRMEMDGDGVAPETMCFPLSTLGAEQYPWLTLLQTGALPTMSPELPPRSYMVSYKWLDRIKRSAKEQGDWFSWLHLGIAQYEECDLTVVSNKDYSEEEQAVRTQKAQEAWLASVQSKPNVWAYRNLAVLEKGGNHLERAENYYDMALTLPGVFDDFALVSEYLLFLAEREKYEKLWNIFVSLPENCQQVDRVRISASVAAVKLKKMDYLSAFFNEQHHDIREGEDTLTDVWFEYCALKMAEDRGLDSRDPQVMEALMDEAWDTCPPSEDIDFRMSLDKKNKYRVG